MKLKEKIHDCLAQMIQRCTNPKHKAFKHYGGRGITVCARWLGEHGFQNFLADLGEPPPGSEIDRINNGGNYEPGNVRWATRYEQARNTRRNINLTISDETLCVSAWSERSGISYQTILNRVRRGWDARRAVFEPTGYNEHENRLREKMKPARLSPVNFKNLSPEDQTDALLKAGLPAEGGAS